MTADKEIKQGTKDNIIYLKDYKNSPCLFCNFCKLDYDMTTEDIFGVCSETGKQVRVLEDRCDKFI